MIKYLVCFAGMAVLCFGYWWETKKEKELNAMGCTKAGQGRDVCYDEDSVDDDEKHPDDQPGWYARG